ncbi:type II toxin-antitoxin system RelE/ParE family toxin [Sphingomonas donggukensis]|uniref:Type II toxin-antitoxin system RelE/ParE family toxin n=1 Tax=Sphingomonas donggukensis TaxID=2949093 RepID=A0ABY4TVR1_9SPHN|nr:type II toxin-antitoxin system RelE/ParE family toxin [Sphingomonas donggukensis]URW76059.1 type II toxin-antitoxin system RelE/ParE family toxin [Sphingomonas donggukensis]
MADLDSLSIYIEAVASRAGADAYDRRIRAKIATLADFPNRGTDRSVFGKGYRSITFERRQIIFYRIDDDIVTIARVLSADRDLRGFTL